MRMASRFPNSFYDPCPVFLERPVHRIQRQVQITGPSDRAQDDPRLAEGVLVAKASEHAGSLGIDELRHFHRALAPVVEPNPQPEARQRLDFGDAPRRQRKNRRRQLNGAIFLGVCRQLQIFDYFITSADNFAISLSVTVRLKHTSSCS
jgi:hypothetical protein